MSAHPRVLGPQSLVVRPESAHAGLDLLNALTNVTAQHLRLVAMDPDVSFARLGLDSLGCIELAAAIEAALGVTVPIDAVTEASTIRSLAAAVLAPAPANEIERMRADAVLPPDIVLRARPERRRTSADLMTARHVLLTGATGFLGREILDRLVAHTGAHVTCLVRQPRALSSNVDRVDTVAGDLSRPRAGLSLEDWTRLVASVDTICHAGAAVNWIGSYAALHDVNVGGTRELLRLAIDADAAFHFVSSVSVCYSTRGPMRVDEDSDPMAPIDGLHFGYAQTKAVAEALVRQAAARGLRTHIYRPALLSGHSRTGHFNAGDMLTALIAGCVRMGAAPDLDWSLDALPVDAAAEMIVRLSGTPASLLHLVHPRPRHWRECVLWMRVYGYNVRLVPYREWTARLRDGARAPGHPLYALRPFFLDERDEGLTIPELHEDRRRPHLDAGRTHTLIAAANVQVTPLDAALLDTYFRAFVEEGVLPPKGGTDGTGIAYGTGTPCLPPIGGRTLARALLEQAGCSTDDLSVTPFGCHSSIISELTAWRAGAATGVFDVTAGGARYVLKVKPHADEAYEVGAALADVCGVGDAYRAHGRGLGIDGGHERELALYRSADIIGPSHMPRLFAAYADTSSRTWAMLLERMEDTLVIDAVDRPHLWTREHVHTAIDGLASIHARSSARIDGLRAQPWMNAPRTTATMEKMRPLWRALAHQAAPRFAASAGNRLVGIHTRLIDDIASWRPMLDAAPHTLIHNDFNPRNVAIRAAGGQPTLCAFDWELATIGAPVRDLAEFLCFVLPASVDTETVEALVARHRDAFASTAGIRVNRDEWQAAFAAALAEFLIDRLAIYALVDRVKPQRFLPRVLCRWLALFRGHAQLLPSSLEP